VRDFYERAYQRCRMSDRDILRHLLNQNSEAHILVSERLPCLASEGSTSSAASSA
jgi:hypothetical protein